jgi:insertion element IS1 protein InsB
VLASAVVNNRALPEEREEILRAYDERSSLRGLSRTFGVSRHRHCLAQKKVAGLPDLCQTLVAIADPMLELDELWSFVLKKARERWIWIAPCRQTRQGRRLCGWRQKRADVPPLMASNS